MHMAWVKTVCGRIKSDFRYSTNLVYNNFPWPEAPTDKQMAKVEARAQAVLDARALFSESTLADLYDPLSMPAELSKAHAELDRAVDACYGKRTFASDRERVEFLFGLYEKLTAPLTAGLKAVKKRRSAVPADQTDQSQGERILAEINSILGTAWSERDVPELPQLGWKAARKMLEEWSARCRTTLEQWSPEARQLLKRWWDEQKRYHK
jgi:hypothetical protein